MDKIPLDVPPGGQVYISDMETLTTREAVARVGAPNVAKFLRLADKHDVLPVFSAPGTRGAKFWSPHDIDRLARAIATTTEVA